MEQETKLCVLCGEQLADGTSSFEHHEFKKMCINCEHCEYVEGNYLCKNDENKNAILNKMREAASAVTEAYKVTNMDIAPLPLKKPLSKCKHWSLSEEVRNRMETLFK